MQDPMQVDMIKAMGGIPVPMGTPEVYSAIQQGQIDGNATGPQLLWALKNHEVAKHLSFTNHGRAAAVVVMNLKKWNSLSGEQKKVLDEASKAFFAKDLDYFTTNPNTADDKVVGFMANAGVTVTEPDIAAFRKATLPVVQAFKKRVKSPLPRAGAALGSGGAGGGHLRAGRGAGDLPLRGERADRLVGGVHHRLLPVALLPRRGAGGALPRPLWS
jgi:TRAP-type C4-dicarboxylate transport system substrate-binding protein